MFDDGNFSEFETVLLSDSMAHLPPEVLSKNFGVDEQAFKNIPKQELFIFQADVPGSLEADQKAPRENWKVVGRFRFSDDGYAADEAHQRRRGAHR